jgi:hypothetical protein
MKPLVLLFAAILLVSPVIARTQAGRDQVQVRTKHANVHMGPNSTTQVLLLVPKGTRLPVIERRAPWVLVELSPKLRETGIPMRWYKSEKQGWLHESYVEPPARK